MANPYGVEWVELSSVVRRDIYPAIDPTAHYQNQTYKGKVVFVSGASRGIGEETALSYARAGAALILTARNQKTLDEVKAAIQKQVPRAEILTVPMDVKSAKAVDRAMKAAIDRFGKLDICIANAGTSGLWNKSFAEQDPDDWWDVMEVNIRGTFHVARAATPHLVKTKGYLVVMSSVAAQFLWPKGSAYGISKHALCRFVEFCALEYPEMKTFSIHPGGIKTQTSMLNPELEYNMLDTVQLPAATLLEMTSGKYDWLSGRYISANWDLGELQERWKDGIIKSKALVSRLAMPKL